MAAKSGLAIVNQVQSLILVVRGEKVILDRDLATLYEVETRILNRAVQRNLARFPDDFMFQLVESEASTIAKTHARLRNLKFARRPPFAFTEHGAIMAASVLNSPRAVEVGIFVVRAFVKLRQLITAHKELAQKLTLLERKLGDHDEAIVAIMDAIKQLMDPPAAPPKSKIGFR